MLTGRRYRLDLTSEQTELAERVGGMCRAVWNTGLEQRREYRRRGAWMNYNPQAGELADAKREHPWLGEVPGHCLQQTLKDLDRACRTHGTWHVNWRGKSGKYHWSPSFRFPEGGKIQVQRLNRRTGAAKLPKLGWVRFRMSRDLDGPIRFATVSRDGDQWFVAFCVEDGQTSPDEPTATGEVGIDRGVTEAVATSDGDLADREVRTGGESERYRRLQQQLSRQRKGTANRRRTQEAIRRLKRRERDRRADFCTQTGQQLARSNGLVVLEDLRTQNMTRSAKGTVEEPGSNVKAKAGLNRQVLDKGWHQLELAIRNTARYTGARVVKVPAAYTSQTCSRCRVVAPESRESQARFRCVTCGHSENADVNAAKNVLAAGQAVTACGDLGDARSEAGTSGKPRGITTPHAALPRRNHPPEGG